MVLKLNRIALRTSLLYWFLAALWILFSDRILFSVVADSATASHLQTYKGWFFVSVTALLLFLGLRNQLRSWELEARARRQAEASLRASNERLRLAMDAARMGTWESDLLTGRLYWSDNLWPLFGLKPDPENLRFETFRNAVHPEDRARVLQAIADSRAGDQPYLAEFRVLRPDGTIRWASSHGRLVRDETGRPIRVIGVDLDITERKQAEVQMRESEARTHASDRRLAEIVQGMSEACFALDPEWRFIFVNDRSEDLFHQRREEMLGRSIWEVFAKLVGTPIEVNYRRAMAERIPLAFEAFSPIAQRWLDIRLFPSGDGLAAFLLDIHERKLAEAEIRALNSELEERVAARTAELEAANQELEAFSYSVSHDLRAPLRAVDGYSQAVLEDYGPLLPEEGQRFLRTIRHSAQRMGQLIDDLLAFSRFSRAPLKKQTLNAAQLVRDALGELALQQKGRRLEIRVGELPPCQGDPALLKQVWINLLANAIKYTAKRELAVVEIDALNGPGGVSYCVRDNGTGFDMRHAGKLFGVFQRLHRADEYEGTGVGLAIVQRIVHRHGGRVWAEAEPDKGARFYFTLEGGNNI